MARRMTTTIRAARAAFELASSQRRPLPILIPDCPICKAPIFQATTGERRIMRHFVCHSCGLWTMIDDADIRAAIIASSDRDEDDHAYGHGFMYLWFNAETGRLILYPTDAAIRRRQEFLARAAARAQEATS